MKITIDIDLDDLLTVVEDEESGCEYYEMADSQEIHNNIKNKIENTIIDNIRYSSYLFDKEAKEIIKEHSDEIINEVIKKVTEKIMSSKKIVEFKKELIDKLFKGIEGE